MIEKIRTVDIANSTGIANLYGMSTSSVYTASIRDDFPKPLNCPHVSGSPLWDMVEVRKWVRRYRPDWMDF